MLTLRQVFADDQALVADLTRVDNEVTTHDMPSLPPTTADQVMMWLKHPRVGADYQYHLAYQDGVLVGSLELSLPKLDNLDSARLGISVVPSHRRGGVGRELFIGVIERVRALGRHIVTTHSVWSLPGIAAHDDGAGPAFAVAMGLESADLPEVIRRLDLSTLDNARLDELFDAATAKSAGYKMVQWIGATSDEYVDDIAYLDSRLILDAPMGNLAIEPEKVDADRIRANEAAHAQRGQVTYHTAMVHEESGRLVAWTTIGHDRLGVEWHAWQYITIVDPDHRGHRLGMLVKVANLRHVREHLPALRVIDTGNAAVNSYMISINESMGFKPILSFQNWQTTLVDAGEADGKA